jgi:hypothetical protein
MIRAVDMFQNGLMRGITWVSGLQAMWDEMQVGLTTPGLCLTTENYRRATYRQYAPFGG